MSDLVLDPVQQRVLGCLLEKQRTVPGSYPMTLNGLRTACNQSSSRNPVVDYDEQQVQDCLRSLKESDLVRFVWEGRGSRVVKYHQLLAERLDLQGEDEIALLAVLLLRGEQTTGELKARAERLHRFDTKQDVEQCLARLAERNLAAGLERRPGQHDPRWAHLLGPAADGELPHPAEPDRESVLAGGTAARDQKVTSGYAVSAAAYSQARPDGMADRPFDRWLLQRLAGLAEPGPVADVCCGPGVVTGYLAAHGLDATGFDLSPQMVEQARSRYPQIEFQVGDLFRLIRPVAAAGYSAITCWYGMVHLAPSELAAAFAALTRVLVPGGVFATGLHAGHGVQHVDDMCGVPVDLDVVLHDPGDLLAAAAAAGLTDVEWYLRGPQDQETLRTERFYLLGRAS